MRESLGATRRDVARHRDECVKMYESDDEVAIGMLRNRLITGFNAVYIKGKEDRRDFGS